MGWMTCGAVSVQFDDRLLSHLQIVIMQRFRHLQSFSMSWLDPLSIGDGRSSIWLHPDGDLYFKFSGSRSPSIDQAWLDLLHRSAASSRGLVVTNESGLVVHAEGLIRP